jgi:hypothetical protein
MGDAPHAEGATPSPESEVRFVAVSRRLLRLTAPDQLAVPDPSLANPDGA